jgi:hypothetical protein
MEWRRVLGPLRRSVLSATGLRAGVILSAAVVIPSAARDLGAQQVDTASTSMMHLMVQAVPVITRATPTADRRSLTEAYLTQPMLMFGSEKGVLHAAATLDFEGLTIPRGELNTGAEGEGFADRRHPHTYLHELMLGADRSVGPVSTSLYAGRGFAPFGSDDPMVRPFEKYPANHHLAQILERVVAIGTARWHTMSVEAALFNGDEPTGPATAPRYGRFGDSRSSRLTWNPAKPLELSGSIARVTSPEVARGGGLDQRKESVVARWKESSMDRDRYLFGEWAGTSTYTSFGNRTAAYDSWLAEASICRGGPRLAARLERTDRPEDSRLTDPFRTPNPPSDNSILGITRWTAATLAVSTFAPFGKARARPFVELERLSVKSLAPGSFFDPRSYYGSSAVWMASVGAKVSAGSSHDRMGRYGAALAPEAAANNTTMTTMPGMNMSVRSNGENRCGD